ncbi:MAG: sugar phosphate isomerase/epimerase family protein [Christensenellales bacterium]|jgi:sugar phosphate isomerase/epimerase
MVFGMSTACFFPHVYTEHAIDLMGKMGIKNVEIFFSCMTEYSKVFIKELKSRMANHDISAYSVHALSIQFEPQLFSMHKRARQEAIDIFKQVLEAGAQLGAEVYVFHGPSDIKRARKLTLDFSHIAETADFLSDMAKQYDIKLAWENVHWCWYARPDFAGELLRRIHTDNLYFTLDIKQAAQAGYDPIDFLEYTKGKLVNIHICDYSVSKDRGIYPMLPFKGSIDFKAFKRALENIGYDRAMILEVYRNNFSDYTELLNNFKEVKSFFSD